jgi:hypothetical protein
MDATTLKIGGLLEVAEAQQHAVAAQLEQLTRQTEALAQAVANVNTAADNAVIALEDAAGAAIDRSIRDSLSHAANTALAALQGVSEPVMATWSAMTEDAKAAEAQLRRAISWFSWRWIAIIGALGVGMMAGIVLAAKALVWWETFQINSLLRQRAELTEEVSRLEAMAEKWSKKAGRATLSTCNGRLCVQVEEKAGRWAYPNEPSRPYLVIKGY